jgi:hypothetical protein
MRKFIRLPFVAIPVVFILAGIWWVAEHARADGIITGRVEWTSPNNILDFRTNNGDEHQIYVDPQARITHNGQQITLNQLKLGWSITIQYVDTDKGPVAIDVAAASMFGLETNRADQSPQLPQE